MKRHSARFAVFFIAFFVFLPMTFFSAVSAPAAEEPVDQCVKCHTSSRTLIKIAREIRKACPEPAKSTESKGEG
ncbi:MAG: hypothetical protein P9L99_00500 [Candidatus Lernaella stagnicola]|nr:hypothetical protein [Candidatus Lernaella stagnicola]